MGPKSEETDSELPSGVQTVRNVTTHIDPRLLRSLAWLLVEAVVDAERTAITMQDTKLIN